MKDERILIVEDEIIIASMLEEMLNNLGYNNIEIASTAKSTIELLNQNTYNLVLMDIKLGNEKDGIDIILQLKGKKDIPVIYVTGNSDDSTIKKASLTTPHGFITKPLLESQLKIQLELALHKEAIKKYDKQESELISNLYEGDCSGLSIIINLDGTIVNVSPHIKKITGKPSYEYKNRKLELAGFDKKFYDFLSNVLKTVKKTDQRIFYTDIYSPYLGNRTLYVEATINGFFSYKLFFTDITGSVSKNIDTENTIDISIACTNQDILKGFNSITSVIPNSRIVAEIEDIDSLKQFLEANTKGVILLDINMEGLNEILKDSDNSDKIKKVLMVSPLTEIAKLKSVNENLYDGYISKISDDNTIKEAFDMVISGKKYYDKSIRDIPLQN